MYRVHMYNTWFGDCFRLNNLNNNLFVDFGIHQKCLSKGAVIYGKSAYGRRVIYREDVHDVIANEILSFDKMPDLLLTHYHVDHESGLLYMRANYGKCTPIFDKVYLPNIWDFPETNDIVTLLLLEDLMDKCKLGKKGCTLLELVRFLCTSVNNVELLQRGQTFYDDSFVTLWPDPNRIGATAREVKAVRDMLIPYPIDDIAEELATIVRSLVYEGRSDEARKGTVGRIEYLIGRIEEIKNEIFPERFKEENAFLNKFGNNISIVFQNKLSDDRNMLFTGDLGAGDLKLISSNYDKKVAMHNKYKYIKIPHHGTKGAKNSNYFNFSKYNPEIMMFTSGECCNKEYMISDNYKMDIQYVASKGIIKVYCSNSNWCKMNSTGRSCDCKCGATTTRIVFPYVSIEVI